LCTHCIAIQSIVIQSTPSKGLSSNTAIGDGWMLFEEKREKEKGCDFWVFQLAEV
jgi:hypothetical protein